MWCRPPCKAAHASTHAVSCTAVFPAWLTGCACFSAAADVGLSERPDVTAVGSAEPAASAWVCRRSLRASQPGQQGSWLSCPGRCRRCSQMISSPSSAALKPGSLPKASQKKVARRRAGFMLAVLEMVAPRQAAVSLACEAIKHADAGGFYAATFWAKCQGRQKVHWDLTMPGDHRESAVHACTEQCISSTHAPCWAMLAESGAATMTAAVRHLSIVNTRSFLQA